MNPWVALVLTVLGTIFIGASVMMLARGTMPPPFAKVKASPALSTFLLILGMTMVMHFGWPDLLNALIQSLVS